MEADIMSPKIEDMLVLLCMSGESSQVDGAIVGTVISNAPMR